MVGLTLLISSCWKLLSGQAACSPSVSWVICSVVTVETPGMEMVRVLAPVAMLVPVCRVTPLPSTSLTALFTAAESASPS